MAGAGLVLIPAMFRSLDPDGVVRTAVALVEGVVFVLSGLAPPRRAPQGSSASRR